MAEPCAHVSEEVDPTPEPGTPKGCEECLEMGSSWVHLRLCLECGHVGCCDNSPNKHATRHFQQTEHPLIRSYEPGEDWWWCYVHEVGFDLSGSPAAPSYQ